MSAVDLKTFEDAWDWLTEEGKQPNLMLGNGFSIAYDPARFSYGALANGAEMAGRLPAVAENLIRATGVSDFESIMRTLSGTLETLKALDPTAHAGTISGLTDDLEQLRDALVHAVADLHPDRPYDIEDFRYIRTREFLDRFKSIYTVSYDLLLYWSLMQDLGSEHPSKSKDDGFRDSGQASDDTVKWDLFMGTGQTVHYLHGALHLFQSRDGLRKVTWNRTNDPLIEQVRGQLNKARLPVFISEGESIAKLDKINRSAYLSRSLRSLGNCQVPLAIFGQSLDANDAHILDAIVRSKVQRIAVSLHGDPKSVANREIISRARDLIADRDARGGKPLEIEFYDASSVALW